MSPEQQMVLDFHKKFQCFVSNFPTNLSAETLLLRCRLIADESAEFIAAASKKDFPDMVDSLVDLLYVVYGTAVCLGVDLEPVFKEVHRANMTKILSKEADGKVQKGSDWIAPNIDAELTKQGWNSGK